MDIHSHRPLFRRLVALALLLPLSVGSLQAQGAATSDTVRLTLDSCLSYAFGHNVTVQTALLQREAAASALTAARLSFTPSLSASVGEDITIFGGTTSANTSYGVGGSLVLFNGLQQVNNLRQSKVEQRRSDLAVDKSRNDIATEIVSACLDIMANSERLGYLRELQSTSQEQAEDGAAKMRAGSILESDWLMLDASSRKAACDVDNARLAIDAAAARLRVLLNLPGRVPIAIEALAADTALMALPSLDEVIRRASETLPDLQMADLAVQKAEYDLRMARGGYAPSLGLNAYASYFGGESYRTDASGMIVTNGGINTTLSMALSIPIVNRGNTRTRVAQAKLSLQQAQLDADNTRQELVRTIEERYNTLCQARNTYAAARLMQQANEATLRVYQAKFNAGTVSTVELVQQQERYLTAVNDYVQSKYSCLLSQKILEIYTGAGL